VATLKPQSNGPLYSSTVIGTLAVDGWAVKFGTARLRPAHSPLLAVPNVTAHPPTASVPTSYHSMWHCNCLCTLKGQLNTRPVCKAIIFSDIEDSNRFVRWNCFKTWKWCCLRREAVGCCEQKRLDLVTQCIEFESLWVLDATQWLTLLITVRFVYSINLLLWLATQQTATGACQCTVYFRRWKEVNLAWMTGGRGGSNLQFQDAGLAQR